MDELVGETIIEYYKIFLRGPYELLKLFSPYILGYMAILLFLWLALVIYLSKRVKRLQIRWKQYFIRREQRSMKRYKNKINKLGGPDTGGFRVKLYKIYYDGSKCEYSRLQKEVDTIKEKLAKSIQWEKEFDERKEKKKVLIKEE